MQPEGAFSELVAFPPIDAAGAVLEIVSAGLALQRRGHSARGISFRAVLFSFWNHDGDVS